MGSVTPYFRPWHGILKAIRAEVGFGSGTKTKVTVVVPPWFLLFIIPLSLRSPLSSPLSTDCEMAGMGDTNVVVVAATEMLAEATTGTGVDT